MMDDVEVWLDPPCMPCQQDKVERAKPVGLLEPLPVPDRPWLAASDSNLPPLLKGPSFHQKQGTLFSGFGDG